MKIPDAPTRRLWAGAFMYALLAAVLVVSIPSLYFLVQNARNGAATRDLLVECVIAPEEREPPVVVKDPERDCYTRGINRQGNAIQSLSSVSIVAAACGAAHPGDVVATRACVEKELAR